MELPRVVMSLLWLSAFVAVLPAGEQIVGEQIAGDLAPPVRIMAGERPVESDTGWAAPCVGDFDGDGKFDLLVGQFRQGPYCDGKLRIYCNLGSNAEPRFGGFEPFVAGGKIGAVPSGCRTGFCPQLVDLDSDGRTDVLSGSGMPGEVFFFRRQADGTFAPGRTIEYEKADPKRPCYNLNVFAHDWDSDGDLDLLVDQSPHICFVPNTGSCRKLVFGKAQPLEADGRPVRAKAACVADWDGDGKDDLLAIRGGVLWYRNMGGPGKPVLQSPVTLVPVSPSPNSWKRRHDEPPELPGGPCCFVQARVADFNGDSRLDLLLGDNCFVTVEYPELTEPQRQAKDAAKAGFDVVYREYSELRTAPNDESDEARRQREKQFAAKKRQCAEAWSEVDKFGPKRHLHNGWVWLYERLAVEETR